MPDDVMVGPFPPQEVRRYPPAPVWLPWRRLAPLAVAAACAGLAVLYYRQSLTAPFNADGAANVLQAQAMVDGNPLLRGWWTSDVSFYTTELPVYALVTAIRGLSPDVQHVSAAIGYALTVLLAALVARGRARGPAGACRAGVALGITLALCVTGSIGYYLENPNHARTVAPVLLLLVLLDRADQPRARPAAHRRRRSALGAVIRGWRVPALACVVLALADVGDELTLAIATLPLGAVCVIRLAASARGSRLRLDGALLAAVVASAGIGEFVNVTVGALGGFDLRPVNGVLLVPVDQAPTHARLLWQAVVALFGANQPGAPGQPQMRSAHLPLTLIAGCHVIGLVLALAGLLAGIAAFRRRPGPQHGDRVTQVLTASILILAGFAAFTTLIRSPGTFHEVAPLMPLGAALAGRVLPPLLARWWASRRAPLRAAPVAALALGGWLALDLAQAGFAATFPVLQPTQQPVADWLVGHHLSAGLSGYWQAASTTVDSDGRVLVAGITLPGAGSSGQPASVRPAAYRWESSASWYQPGEHHATFVIGVIDTTAPGGGLPVPGVRAAFGRPSAEHQIGNEVIMLYDRNVLTRLAPTAFPG